MVTSFVFASVPRRQFFYTCCFDYQLGAPETTAIAVGLFGNRPKAIGTPQFQVSVKTL